MLVRDVADLFAACGQDAQTLLLAADADPDATAVAGEDGRRVQALAEQVCARLGPAAGERARAEAARIPRREVVERALHTLALLRQHPPSPAPAAAEPA